MRTVQDLWGKNLETLLCQFSDQRRLEWVERQHIPGYCKDINPWKINYKFKVILRASKKIRTWSWKTDYEHGSLGMKDKKKKTHGKCSLLLVNYQMWWDFFFNFKHKVIMIKKNNSQSSQWCGKMGTLMFLEIYINTVILEEIFYQKNQNP